jgi:type III restriction enzyme
LRESHKYERMTAIIEASGLSSDKTQDLLSLKQQEQLCALVDIVGKREQLGQKLQNVISVAMASEIDLERALDDFRLQNLIFRAARKLFLQNADSFGGDKQFLAVQLIRIVEQFLNSGKLNIPSVWHQDRVRKQILFALNMDTVVGHVNRFVTLHNTEKLEAVFDELFPIGSTARMRSWVTTRPCQATVRSQISHVVHDSAWEKVPQVVAWAKNDHLDFVIRYLWKGSSRNFVPDYLIRLSNGKTLVLEVKGVDDERNRAKRAAMAVWIKTVNEQGGFGQWCFDVVFEPARTCDVILQHAGIAG